MGSGGCGSGGGEERYGAYQFIQLLGYKNWLVTVEPGSRLSHCQCID